MTAHNARAARLQSIEAAIHSHNRKIFIMCVYGALSSDCERNQMKFFSGKFIVELKDVFSRFPIPILCSALLTVLLMHDDNIKFFNNVSPFHIFIPAFLAAGAFTLWAENRAGINGVVKHLGALVLAIIFGLVGGLVNTLDVHFLSFYGGLTLPLLIAAFLGRKASEDQIWIFSAGLCFASILAIIAGLAFGLGLWSVFGALVALFDFHFLKKFDEEVWIFSLCFVGPVIGLTLTPNTNHSAFVLPEQRSAADRGMNILINYILMPLIVIYALILHFYGVKIALAWSLPKGQIGFMVLSFATALIITQLIAQPWQERCNRLTQFMIKYWFFLLVTPLILLAMSLFRRISDYGFTPQRYLLVIFGVWMAWLLVGSIVKRGQLGKVSIIGSIAFMLLVTSFGPWGSRGFSISDQTSRFVEILERNNLMEDGAIKAVIDKNVMTGSDKKQARNIVYFLGKEKALDRLKPLFERQANNPFDKAEGRYNTQQNIIDLLGLKKDPQSSNKMLNFNASQSQTINISNAEFMLRKRPNWNIKLTEDASNHNEVRVNKTTLEIRHKTEQWDVPLAPILNAINERKTDELEPYVHRFKSDGRPIKIIIHRVQAQKSGNVWKNIRNVDATIIFEKR